MRFAVPQRLIARLAGLLAIAGIAVGFAPAAHAAVTVYNEPAFTKASRNTWTIQYTRIGGSSGYYYVCSHAQQDGIEMPGEWSNGLNGPATTNCTGNLSGTGVTMNVGLNAGSPSSDGHSYRMCFMDYYDLPYAGWSSIGPEYCANTTLDTNKPAISTGINGADEFTGKPTVNVQINYQDATSYPWKGTNGASNWVCFSQGASCTPGQVDANCSQPAAWNKVTQFNCTATLPSDGKWYACAKSADSAVPDGANWGSATSAQANISDVACGWITLDRVGPQVSVTPSATTVHVGDLVNFSSQVTDAVSGVAGDVTWTFGDNTAGATGGTAAHTFTQAGTYQVTATGKDGAGNAGSGKSVITVVPASTGGGGGTTTTGGGGTTTTGGGGTTTTGGGGTTTTGGGTTTIREVLKEVQGPTQATSIGSLDVTTAKTVKLTRTLKRLPLALTADTPGTVNVALLKGARIVAKGGTKLAGADTFAYRLKLPKTLKAGSYKLKVSFTPQGAARATTRTLKLRLTGKRAKASAAPVTTARA